jgi:hypothetical protein
MLALHEIAAVPDPVMLFGLIAPHVKPDGAISVRLTVPAKWFTLVIVMVVVVDEPALVGRGVDAAIPKSRNWNRAVVLCSRELLVPVAIRV